MHSIWLSYTAFNTYTFSKITIWQEKWLFKGKLYLDTQINHVLKEKKKKEDRFDMLLML